jgi:hypothetical protein
MNPSQVIKGGGNLVAGCANQKLAAGQPATTSAVRRCEFRLLEGPFLDRRTSSRQSHVTRIDMGAYDHLHAENIKHDLRGKNVLVTGGTQGIGSGSLLPNSPPNTDLKSPFTSPSSAQM